MTSTREVRAPREQPVPSIGPEQLASHSSDRSVGAPGEEDFGERSLLELFALLLRHRRLLVAIPFAFALLVVGVTLAWPKAYTTSFSFTPVTTSVPNNISSLASQFGVNLAMGGPSESPDFYASVLRTPDILSRLATSAYAVRSGNDTIRGTFIELYDIRDKDEGRKLDKALRELQEKVLTIGFDRTTAVVSVGVRTDYRDLSFQMATRLLSLLDSFNLSSRQQQAALERKFLQERVDTVRAELFRAENGLEAFLRRNRSYQNDPSLEFDHDRLQREVGLRQQVYSMLMQALEQARLQAVRNTPSVTLVQQPTYALRFDRRHTLVKMVVAWWLAFAAVFLLLLGRELIQSGRTRAPANYATLDQLLAETREDLGRFAPRAIGRRQRAT